jgi:hypothetical protein
MRWALLAVVLCGCGCGRTPDASSTPPKATAEPTRDAMPDASTDAGAHVPGLPMPQQFPRLVWDAAAAADAQPR